MDFNESKVSIPVIRVQLIRAAVWVGGLWVLWDLGHALIKVVGAW